MTKKAFDIADSAMKELLRAHCVNGNDDQMLGLCDQHGCEVGTLEEADPTIREAFEWLALRQLATLETDGCGQCIRFVIKAH